MTVYPRVCGGTGHGGSLLLRRFGLSPRVRGNQACRVCDQSGKRSIPACAGEPCRRPARFGPAGVYPRVCGGTEEEAGRAAESEGLSPRVRGNPVRNIRQLYKSRSIPACAGEPYFHVAPVLPGQVYPRVCGGTPAAYRPCAERWGLSPRVRGNRRRAGRLCRQQRSIPACAGEPCATCVSKYVDKVYPRVCGGTVQVPHEAFPAEGLSCQFQSKIAHFCQSKIAHFCQLKLHTFREREPRASLVFPCHFHAAERISRQASDGCMEGHISWCSRMR